MAHVTRRANEHGGAFRVPALPRPVLVGLVLLAICLLGPDLPSVNAATIVTGPTPTDTVVRTDGTAAYVLNSGNSTLSVVDPATNVSVATIPLGQAINTCIDIDWNNTTQRVYVGSTTGLVLDVDPATSIVTPVITNPAANYSIICADNLLPGTLAWGIDLNTGNLDEFLVGGAIVTRATLPFAASVELVEKAPNGTWMDNLLVMAGTSPVGQASAVTFDRSTWMASAMASWPTAAATATGLTTSNQGEAYVTANDNATGMGYLIQLSLAGMLFAPAPIWTGTNLGATDVTMAGDYLSVLAPGTPGTEIHLFDAANPANVLHAGWINVDPINVPFGGFSSWMGTHGTIDDLYLIHANQGLDANGEHSSAFLDSVNWTPTAASTITNTGFNLAGTTSLDVHGQEATTCAACPPQEGHGRGLIDSGDLYPTDHYTPKSVQYATAEEIYTLPITAIPGVGLDLGLVLTYRSRIDYDYRYGQGWTFNQDVRLRTEATGDKTYLNGHGRRDTYLKAGGSTFIPPVHYDTTLAVGGSTTTITNRFGTVSTFDANGYRTSLADRYGNTISYTWTGDQLTGIQDTLGRSYTLSYDATGRLSSISDFGGRTWTFTYDYLGQLVRMTTPSSTQFASGRSYRFTYSGNNAQAALRSNLVHVWSPKGTVVQSFTYDSNDRVTKEEIGSDAYTMTYALSGTDTVATVTDRSGNVTEWTFGLFAMPIRKEVFTKGLRTGEPTSYVTTWSVNGTTGLVDHVVYPRSNRVDLTYDASLNLTEVRQKQTNTSSTSGTDLVHAFQYGAHNQRTQYTDPRGNVTTYTVDGSGNTTRIDYPTITSPASQSIAETFGYDSFGRITSATDGANRQVTFQYYTTGSQKGYLQTVTRDPTGLSLQTTFGYDPYGNVTSVTDPRSNQTTITVDAENFVTEIQAPSPLSYRRRVTYDLNRNVSKVEVENIDRKGVQDPTTPWIDTAFTYDEIDRLLTRVVRLTASTTATTSYAYDGSGNPTEITEPQGNKTKLEWDERHLLFKATRGQGTTEASTVEYTYDDNGSLVTLKDGRGYSTSYTYDLFGRRTKTTNALGHYVDFLYDKSSNLTGIEAYDSTAVLQAKTTRYYDEIDRLWKVVRDRFGSGLTASYPTTIFTRDQGHLLTQVQDPLTKSTTYAYDAAGRLTTVTDAASNQVVYTLDANGNVTRVSDTEVPATGPNETFVTEFDYDELNRVTTKREIDRLNALNIFTTTFEYDSRSNLSFRTDAEGHPVRWTYDLASRLTKYERALQVGAQIDTFLASIDESFAYDTNDRLTTVTDDNFNATTYLYDALNRRTRTTYADTRFVTYSYDANSNLSGWADQNGTSVTNTHDALDRLTYRSVTKGTGVLGSTYELFSYDALNRMLTAADDDYQVELTYDSVGNVLKDKQGYNVLGSELWKTVQTAYTDAGSTSGITYPSAFQVTHTRDSIYRLSTLHDVGAAANIATFTWQGRGRLATTTNQNGTGTEYIWDGFRRIQEIDHTLSGGGSLHKLEYLYDKVHNRRMEKNSFSSTWISTLPAAVQTFLNGRNGKGDVYAYDWAYRLIDARYDVTNPATEVQSPGTQPFVKLVQYTMDGLGNRSQVQTTPPTPPSQVTYATDVVNQYTQVGGVTRTHDGNGNLTDDGTYLFAYDFENRLVEVKLKSTQALVATYKYDAIGRRVEKAVNGGATTRYILEGVQVVEEYDGSNLWQARYVYEDGIDRPRSMDRADIADVNGNSNTTEVLRFHYHQQALGSVTEMSQPTGAVVEWVTYDVYGQPTIRDRLGNVVTQSAVGNPYLFTGREYDPEDGLYFYRARQYDPLAGRFLQRDAVGYTSSLSLYLYSRGSPATYSDPSGHYDWTPSPGAFDAYGAPPSPTSDMDHPATPEEMRAADEMREQERREEEEREGDERREQQGRDREQEATDLAAHQAEVIAAALRVIKDHGPDWTESVLPKIGEVKVDPKLGKGDPAGKTHWAGPGESPPISINPLEIPSMGTCPWSRFKFIRLVTVLLHELVHVHRGWIRGKFKEGHPEVPDVGINHGGDTGWTEDLAPQAEEAVAEAEAGDSPVPWARLPSSD